ncbi:MAG: penicillin-binding protein 2 [Synechococcales cyanobacterium T60_A2020_003]|nr:penicillin-binding protein 2 [Synechococcales cyanobacterium T60_A2020_003]
MGSSSPRLRSTALSNYSPANRRSARRRLSEMPVKRTGLNSVRSRLLIVWGLLMLGLGALALNLVRIQVFQAGMLQARATDQQTLVLSATQPRRSILDRNGTVMAIDEPVYTLYAHPIMFQKDVQEIAASLAPILEKPVPDLLQTLTSGESGIRILDGIPEDMANRIRNLRLDGLELLQTYQRFYPQQDLFGPLLGYVDVDRQAQAGIEMSQADAIERTGDGLELRRTGDGFVLPTENLPEQASVPDQLQLQTTLDSDLQRVAQDAIQKQVETYKAKRGVVLVMDALDGSLLTMAGYPSYDPNQYYKADVEQFKNWAISDVYEPGSTFKPINVAIALQEGVIQPDDYVDDPGHIQIGEWPIENFDYKYVGGRGSISITEVLKNSSNVGMVRIMRKLQPSVYYKWLQKLGLGELTGIDLPFEGAGYLKDKKQFVDSAIEPATAAFGQGLSLTPIQLLQIHAALANGGKLVVPHLVKGLVDSSGQVQWQPERAAPKQIFDADVTRKVLKMMETVVTDGTGQNAQVPGYRVAGKTGTSQKAGPNGGYLDGVKITSFVATFPVENPRYVVLAVVDEPVGADAFGSTVAAPAVRAVIETLITLEKLPPSEMDEFSPGPRPVPEAEATTPGDENANSEDADTNSEDTALPVID